MLKLILHDPIRRQTKLHQLCLAITLYVEASKTFKHEYYASRIETDCYVEWRKMIFLSSGKTSIYNIVLCRTIKHTTKEITHAEKTAERICFMRYSQRCFVIVLILHGETITFLWIYPPFINIHSPAVVLTATVCS